MTQPLNQSLLSAAMTLEGFGNWRPKAEVPELNRPASRPQDLPGTGRIAAVLVLVYPTVTGAHLVLTKRHANLSKHANQISFPGGSQDTGETLPQTAIRETFEEIGVSPDSINLCGHLTPVYIPPSDFTVTPFVGWRHEPPSFIRSESEVAQIIEVAIDRLLRPATLVVGNIVLDNGDIKQSPFYQVDEHKVWGATAIMLSELIERISRVRKLL